MQHTPGHEGKAGWWLYSSMFKHLPLSPVDCYSNTDFGQKLSSAQLEGNGRMWWT
jgi:hypothetical protein